MSAAVTPDRVTEALRDVIDPELGLSVVDLGLIYGIDVDARTVRVTMTLTAAGCPLHAVMPEWVKRAIRAIPGVEHAEVTLTFEPPWTPDRIVPVPGSAGGLRPARYRPSRPPRRRPAAEG